MVGSLTFLSLLAIFLPMNLSTPPCIHFLSVHCAGVLSHSSRVRLFPAPWAVARQAPLSVGFSRKEYWSGLPCPSPGDLPSPGLPHCRWILYHHSSPPEPPGKLISILMTSKSLSRSSVCHSDWYSYIQQPTWHIPCQLKLIMCKQNLLLTLHLTKQATKSAPLPRFSLSVSMPGVHPGIRVKISRIIFTTFILYPL